MRKWSSYAICLTLVAVLMVLFAARLVEWQFLDGEKYQGISAGASNYYVKLDGARGEILDRNGKPLAATRTTYNVVMNSMEMESNRNPAISEILNLLKEHDLKWLDRLPIIINSQGNYEFVEEEKAELSFLKSDEMLNMQEYATADECMLALTQRYGCDIYSKEEARDIISVRYGMTKTQFSISNPYVIAQDVPMEFVTIISEKSSLIPGVETRISTARDYGSGSDAPHIIGTMGAITQEQYDAYDKEGLTYSGENLSGYTYSDVLGQSGVEGAFEDDLRGKNGKETITLGSEGEIVKTEVTEIPEAGNNVFLTIDKDLQRVLNEALAKGVEGSDKNDCVAGGAVVLDVETFGVLASSSYPNFDLDRYNKEDKYYNELIKDETKPLFNRAINGTFTPGSVMKPAVAVAALEEQVITDSSTVNCEGAYTFYENDPLDCLGIHGFVNVYGALEDSCNTFFCDVGRRLGIDRMEVYANLFGLGKKTGIEISEASGIMSNPEEYLYNHGVEWMDGVTIQAAIGQADSNFSPLQLAAYCATIANDGTRLDTHLMHTVTDFENKQRVRAYEPKVAETVEVNKKNLEIVQEGMREVCDTGTAAPVFSDYGITVAGKTGTAENPNHSDNIVFMAYAPYENPKIAVSVVIEYGGNNGDLAQNVAKEVFDCYFFGKTLEVKEKEAKEAENTEKNSGETTDQEDNANPDDTDTDQGNTGDVNTADGE